MKIKHTNLKLLLICLLFSCKSIGVWGNDSSYPFRTQLTVNPTGAGRVYASYDGKAKESTNNTKNYDDTATSTQLDACSATVTLVASANEGYRFVNWTYPNGDLVDSKSNTTVTQVYDVNGASSTLKYNINLGIFRAWPYRIYNTRRSFSYTANFALQGNVIAKVADGQESVGSADILESELTPGSQITLVASNVNGSEFQGWYFNHWELNGEVVSTDKEIKVTVPSTETVLTYVACFNKTDTEYYCFIRNKLTKMYLKLSDINSFTKPSSTDNLVGSFNGSFTLVNEDIAISDPACVYVVTGTSEGNGLVKASLICQGKSVGFLNNSVVINDNKKGLTLTPASSGAFYIYADYEVKQSGQTANIPIYFRDNNGTPDLTGSRMPAAEWEILELSRGTLSQHFFSVKPNSLLQREGKYYTTLYTTFPYELQSGTAYYVNHESIVIKDEQEGTFRVVCKEVPNGIVPSNSAVIIECDGAEADDNKILPLPHSTAIDALTGNCLQGHIKIASGPKSGDGKMYVLSKGSNTGVGFYKLKKGTAMTDNKVYVNLDEETQALAKNMIFSFGEDFSSESGIATDIQDEVLPEPLTGAAIYDLQGRQVKNPSRGVYIVNGKKFVVK